MKSTPTPRFSTKRLFLLTLVCSVAVAALVGIVVSASKAKRSARARAEAANTKSGITIGQNSGDKSQPLAPSLAAITATLTDNTAAATKVAPGGTINYTAVITNSGVTSPADDATNLNFSAPLDANTTLTAGSVHASPIAFNDTYNWVGNTFLDTTARALPAVTANDVAVNAPGGTDTFTITTIAGGATALSGVVSLAANGSFTYTPPLNRPTLADGATVQDSFTYTITSSADPALTSTGTVRINLTGRVFYLQAGAAGDGRSNTPSGNPATMSTNADKSTDIFYIFSGGAGNVNGVFTLEPGQQLLGQGVNLVVNAITLFTATSNPTTTNTGAGNCVTLPGASAGNNTLSGFNIGNCTGFAIQGTNVGTLAINTLSINTTGGGLDLTGVGTPAVNIVLGGLTSTGGTKNVNLVGLNGTITLASGALSGASGNAFDVTGAGTAGITFSGTITNTAAARVVNISGKTGGTVALSGLVTGTTASTGINLATNTGATINFTGGVNLNAPTAGFAATGPGPAATSGGTVSVTDPNALGTAPDNTIVTTTGTALNVTHTTIGAGGLNFRSISANGAANGIFLNNTGSGSLIVTGDGTNTTKGGNASGGTIQNINGADASNNGIAIYLNNTSGTQLRRITVSGTIQNRGVYGELVNNLTMQYCNIGGTIGTTSGANDLNLECPVEFGKTAPAQANGFAAGSVSTVDNCLISGGIQHNMEVYQQANTASLTISNCNITNNGAALGSDGINIETHTDSNGGTPFAQLTVSVQSCLFDNNKSQALQGNALGDSFLNLTVNSCTIQRTTQGNEGFVIQNGGDADLTTHVTSNTFTGILGTNILVGQVVNNASNLSNLIGVIQSNTMTVGNAGTFPTNRTLIVFFSSTIGLVSTANVLVNANTINTFSDPVNGIAEPLFVSTPDANTDPSFTATVTNNVVNITDTAGTSLRGIAIQSTQNVSAGCIDVRGNDVNYSPGPPAGVNGLRVRQVAPATLQMEQGGAAGTAAARLAANNPLSTTEVVGTVTVVADSTCLTAPTRPEAIDTTVGSRMDQGFDSQSSTKAVAEAKTLTTRPVTPTRVSQASDKAGMAPLVVKATPKASPAEVARIYQSERVLSHHARRSHFKRSALDQNAPLAGENVTLNTIATFPAAKSITIKYSATVNTTALTARQATTQGTVTANAGAISVTTTDPGPPLVAGPTVTLLDTTLTWTGATDTNWNTATNWNRPGPAVSSYAPGVGNSAVNDVVIPAVATQPTIGTTNISVFSLNLANTMTLTITNPFILSIDGGGTGSDLTLNGIISGGFLQFGTGTHQINGAGTGSLSSTNVATVISGSTVTLNTALRAGALAVNGGGSLNITGQTVSLNGSGAALALGGTFTTTGSTVVLDGTAAQTIAGTIYNNLTINNTIGAHVTGVTLTGNATVNGVLTLTSSDLATGAFTLTMPNTATSAPASGASDVVGNVTRTGFVSGGSALSFGNPLNTIRINSGTAPTSINVLLAKNAPVTYAAAALRSYTITPTGGAGITATVRLHYRQVDLANPLAPGGSVSETPTVDFNFRRFTGGGWKAVVPTSRNVGVVEDNWLENNAVTTFSEWTFANFTPTASSGVVTGRIVDNDGQPVEGAVVRLDGTQNRKFITDANGVYRFENVETNGFYTVTPSRANYSFSPATRSFSQVGESTEAAFSATAATGNYLNPLDTPEYFVRQHYLDFLGREPDEAGFNFWSDEIIGCGLDQDCIGRKRENVSAAYFLSIEFQTTGGLVDGLYRAGFGVRPEFAQFMPDTRAIAAGVVVGRDGWQAKLQANKEAFVAQFVNRPAFHAQYDGMESSLFVDTLISHTGVSFTAGERDAMVSGLSAGTMTRAEALTAVAENQTFVNAKFNDAFVMMEYFGYLRRDADAEGFQYWLNKLNQFGGNFEQAEMVKAFIVSGEYRDRFPK